MKRGALLLLFGMGIAACGPVIQLIDVEVKLPAERPVLFDNREIAIFNALYDTTGQQGTAWNDSLLINKVAEGFRDQLAIDLAIAPDSISVFNHFCNRIARGTLEDKEYIYSLSAETGAQMLVLIDSLRRSDFRRMRMRTAGASEYSPLYVSAEWQMVFRIFDIGRDQFTAHFAVKDTLFWNIVARNRDSVMVERKIASSLPETAHYMGALAAQMIQPQWQTQERVLFFFTGSSWVKAMDHAFMFEWEDAQRVWLSMTKNTTNYRKIAYAAFNLAVASEMMGQIDLAKEWLTLSAQYLDIPEIKHYLQILDVRKQQQRTILLQVE